MGWQWEFVKVQNNWMSLKIKICWLLQYIFYNNFESFCRSAVFFSGPFSVNLFAEPGGSVDRRLSQIWSGPLTTFYLPTDILYFYIDRRPKLGTRIIIPNNASLTRGQKI